MADVIRVGSLDFNDIKLSLKTYLQEQAEFTDYNFEGSGISQLINLLAYNTHYTALSANLIANEMFLDTAVKRSSIVSRAKELGYTPRSRRAAFTTLNVSFTNIQNESLISGVIVPRGTKFSSSVNDDTFIFTTTAPVFLNKTIEQGVPVFRGILKVYEGVLTQHSSTYSATDNVVTIPNADIDTSTLEVEVLEEQTWIEYFLPRNYLNVTGDTAAYLIQEGFNGHEVYFGDNIIGKRPDNNSTVRLTYVVTSGAPANGCQNYSLISSILGTTSSTVVNISGGISTGGQDIESNESIKLMAKNAYGTQNRAVTANDYASLAAQHFPNIKDVIAWDGALNVPPKFGRVVLCVQPTVGDVLPVTDKRLVTEFLLRKSVGNVKIDFVDPTYIDIRLDCIVKYNIKHLSLSVFELEYAVKAALFNHNRTHIQKFGGIARYSTLTHLIDDSNHAIVGNELFLTINKGLVPSLFSENTFEFSYNCAIKPNTLISTSFHSIDANVSVTLNDMNGKIHAYRYENNVAVITHANVGTINYATGECIITDLYLGTIADEIFNVTVTPVSLDVYSSKNVILKLTQENMNVNIVRDLSQ